jgi:hypothetical protein
MAALLGALACLFALAGLPLFAGAILTRAKDPSGFWFALNSSVALIIGALALAFLAGVNVNG